MEFEDLREEVRQLRAQQLAFVRGITHDLRTPMTVISGYAQLLLRELQKANADSLWVSNAEAIVTATKRVNDLFQDMIDAELLQAGQLEMELKPLQLQTVVGGMEQSAGHALDWERVKIEIPDDLPPILADEKRLEQVLLNLLANSLSCAPRREAIKLTARLSGKEIIVSVSDRGEGIGQAGMPRTLRGFTGMEERKSGGLGLGLHIAAMLVEAHGGRTWVEHVPAEGATISFTLPLA